jgi:hypothetical protein
MIFKLLKFRDYHWDALKMGDIHINPIGFLYSLWSDYFLSTGGEHLPILQYYELI